MAASEIEKLERMVRENPKGRLFASLADAYRKDGQYPKALEVLEAGLVNHPDYVSARVVLGRVHLTTGDKAKAREAFARVVALDPESVIALKALADLAEEEGQGEEALRWSGQLLTVDPGNDEAIKQQERLAAAAPAPAPSAPEVRLSGIVPMDMGVVDAVGEAVAAASAAPEATVPAFPAITSVPTPVKTVEIPVVSTPTSGPAFTAADSPLDREPEPLPLAPLSEEAQTEQAVGQVAPMAALEPTSFEDVNAGTAPTERMAGLDPVGMTEDEVASIGATSGFEPNAGSVDATDLPRSSVQGLESLSGELVPLPTPVDDGLEREVELELGVSDTNEFQESSAAETLRRRSGANEFQESSVAETLQHGSGVNEFQAPSDGDTLDARSAAVGEAIDTGGTDLAFIEPLSPAEAPHAPPQAPVFTPVPLIPEEPEPAVFEPEPVVTEAMAELYASQGHLAEALDVYRELAARDPGGARYADRIVELEMFVGGAAPVAEEIPAPAPMLPPPLAADTSLEEMELVPPPAEPAPRRPSGPAPRVTVGSWLADVFAEALPGATPAAEVPMVEIPAAEIPEPEPEPVSAPLPMIDLAPEPEAEEPAADPTASLPMIDLSPVSDVAPRGAPTRQASGGFSLHNVFGGERPGAPTAKSGSFDDFFGAAAPKPPTAPAPSSSPSGATSRSTRPSASSPPPGDDDLSSFQDWLKGLKK